MRLTGAEPGKKADMIETIMVATDFSECGNSAIDNAFDLARQLGAKVIILNVIEREHRNASSYIDFKPIESDEHLKKDIDAAKAKLHEIANAMAGDVPYKIDAFVDRFAADGIIHAVNQEKPDMLVIASHGYSRFKRMVLGSVTDKILQTVACPTLIVRVGQ